MAAPNKPSSFSPISSSRAMPSARNSETKDPMRRSFTGNPFSKPSSIVTNSRAGFNPNTPANSPSDFPRRSSIGRESFGSLRDLEDKENGKDATLKAAKVRSPASASKGPKNFMSPTISAASKFTSSPRKKVLVERNEPVRSSVSFSEVKSQVMEENGPKPDTSSIKKKTVTFSDVQSMIMSDDNDFSGLETGMNQDKKIKASHDTPVTGFDEEILKSDLVCESEGLLDSKNNDLGLSSEAAITEEKDCANLDPTFKISPRTSCSTSSSVLAPLDADPLMPPYDPKTNYLSPRPQFLHYRPNPRIEHIRNKDRDGQRLEESFASENMSDSEICGSLSSDSQQESEDVSSDETVIEGEVEDEEELNVSEPNPFNDNTMPKEKSLQTKGVSRSKFFTRSKFVSLLLVLVFAGLSVKVIDSPGTDLSILKELDLSNLYVPPEISEFARVKLEGLAHRSQLWAANSIAYIYKLISDLSEVPKLRGPLQFSNLTDLLEENHLVDGYKKFGQRDLSTEEDNVLVAPTGGEEKRFESLEGSDPEIETDGNVEVVLEENDSARFEEQAGHEEIDEVLEDQADPEAEELCLAPPAEVEKTQERVQSDDLIDVKPQSNVELAEGFEIQPGAEANEPRGENSMDFYAETTESTKADAAEPQIEEILQSSEADALLNHPENSAMEDDATLNVSEDNFLTRNVVGIALLVLVSLLAATAFFNRTNKGKLSTSNAAIPVDQPAATKELDYSPVSLTSEHTRNSQAEDDTVGESSCPSEMSSFRSSSYSKRELKGSSEAQSQERKPRKNFRRESLASSEVSMSSHSYGSFTTYEKIPIKHGLGDDEVVTPVRRSSRLRKQVTSP